MLEGERFKAVMAESIGFFMANEEEAAVTFLFTGNSLPKSLLAKQDFYIETSLFR